MNDDAKACADDLVEQLDKAQMTQDHRRYVIKRDSHTVRATDVKTGKTHILFTRTSSESISPRMG